MIWGLVWDVFWFLKCAPQQGKAERWKVKAGCCWVLALCYFLGILRFFFFLTETVIQKRKRDSRSTICTALHDQPTTTNHQAGHQSVDIRVLQLSRTSDEERIAITLSNPWPATGRVIHKLRDQMTWAEFWETFRPSSRPSEQWWPSHNCRKSPSRTT